MMDYVTTRIANTKVGVDFGSLVIGLRRMSQKGKNDMEIEQIKQLAVDVNNVAEASFQSGKEHFERPLLAKIEKLEKAVQLAINGMDSDSITLLGEYHTGLYCGLEDRGITDRYYACDYGYEKALEKVEEWVIETLREALKGCKK